LIEDAASAAASSAQPATMQRKQPAKRKASGFAGLIGQLRRKFGLASTKAA